MSDYALAAARADLLSRLSEILGTDAIEVRRTPPGVAGDFGVPLFALAKERGVAPPALAAEVLAALDLSGSPFASADAAGGFLNLTLRPEDLVAAVFADFERRGEGYGGSEAGGGATVVIDYSSPNIAKPFSVGHLRSTVIGHSVAELHRFLGYRVIGDNHIGDWGTQFGKLLCAYREWGERERVEERPIQELLALYVRFHEEAETRPELEEEARSWFRRLEEGDPEAVELWRWFRELSLREFEGIYGLLGVRFEEVLGESFYGDRMQQVVERAFALGVASWGEVPARRLADGGGGADSTGDNGDDGEAAGRPRETVALVDLSAHGIEQPLLIQKSDGTSLYATRDLATAIYRIERWRPAKILYVVGGEQQLYFRQLFKTLELMGYDTPCVHVWFGLIRLPKGRMSTRKGRVILLEDVIGEAVSRAEAILADRDLDDEERRRIARVVGIGAIKYADLSQNRMKEVVFDWDRMLNLQGDSAPYLQYGCVRIRSILRKAEERGVRGGGAGPAVDPGLLTEPAERDLVGQLAEFPDVVRGAVESCYPHLVAGYLITLARSFHGFYTQVPVLGAQGEELVATRLRLCEMTLQVLVRGLALLGIEAPERM